MNVFPLELSLKILSLLYLVTDILNLYYISKPNGLFDTKLSVNQIVENALKCFAPICYLVFLVKPKLKVSQNLLIWGFIDHIILDIKSIYENLPFAFYPKIESSTTQSLWINISKVIFDVYLIILVLKK